MSSAFSIPAGFALVPLERQRVYGAVRAALKSGTLIRPTVCGRCRREPPATSDGRSAIQAHHHDYSKPLEVEWICAKCHRMETPLPSVMGGPAAGVRNGQSRLTEDAVREIRASHLGCRMLGKQFGVDKKTIQRVRNGARWKDVK